MAGSSWQIISRLSKFHEIWVITEEHAFKEKIEQYLDSGTMNWNPFISILYVMKPLTWFFIPFAVPLKETMSYRKWLKDVNTLRVFYIGSTISTLFTTFDQIHSENLVFFIIWECLMCGGLWEEQHRFPGS